jgi:hypothetical protein
MDELHHQLAITNPAFSICAQPAEKLSFVSVCCPVVCQPLAGFDKLHRAAGYNCVSLLPLFSYLRGQASVRRSPEFV